MKQRSVPSKGSVHVRAANGAACPVSLFLQAAVSEETESLRHFPRLRRPVAPTCRRATGSGSTLPQKTLTLYQGTEVLKRYPIASGTWETPSPIGVFYITHRFAGELGGFGTRFLGLNVPWGQFGIHGTNRPGSIGSNASHGCIRMFVQDSEELYGKIGNWSRVVIQGGPYGQLDSSLRALRPGDRNSHVAAVQRRLISLGYLYGNADGVYGAGTTAAVRRARKALGLQDGDEVDAAFYRAIGLILFE